VRRTGFIDVAGKTFTVNELNVGQELRLELLLRQLYQKQNGNSYKRVKDMIAEMPKEERPFAVAECVRIEAQGELPGQNAMLLARTTPQGVALELWMRTRATHPEVTVDAFEAIVNELNCLEIHSEMIRVLTPETDDTKS